MTRDNSPLLPTKVEKLSTISMLGWGAFFIDQIDNEAESNPPPVRVTKVHRSGFHVIGNDIETTVPPRADVAVGDWLLLDIELPHLSVLLDRKSLIKRRAPGHDRREQLIAANIDTAFIVTSCNQEFNVARLERYIALAFEADITPVIILTKIDIATGFDLYLKDAQNISDKVDVVSLDARSKEATDALAKWCQVGQTVAFLGSSGVGKSTLSNALTGTQDIETQAIREEDGKGRHTTTRREIHMVPNGCAVLDTPGMRELQIMDAASGVGDLFADLHSLSQECRFNDCLHIREPGCAVMAAIDRGDIEPARMARWQKLVAEDKENSQNLAQRKVKDGASEKYMRAVLKSNKKK